MHGCWEPSLNEFMAIITSKRINWSHIPLSSFTWQWTYRKCISEHVKSLGKTTLNKQLSITYWESSHKPLIHAFSFPNAMNSVDRGLDSKNINFLKIYLNDKVNSKVLHERDKNISTCFVSIRLSESVSVWTSEEFNFHSKEPPRVCKVEAEEGETTKFWNMCKWICQTYVFTLLRIGRRRQFQFKNSSQNSSHALIVFDKWKNAVFSQFVAYHV